MARPTPPAKGKTQAATKASAPGTSVAAPKKGGALKSIDKQMLRRDGAQQKEFTRDDLAIPFLRVLQSNSPQVKKSEAEFIKGATEGMFFNTATKQVFDGDEGVLIVPVAYTPSYIEWKTRENGGGLVKDYGADGSLMSQTQKDDKNRDILPNGNQLVRSALYYVMLVVDEKTGTVQQVAFPLASTQLKKARQWNSFMSTYLTEDEDGKFNPSIYYCAYRVKSVPESNEKGSWMGVNIEREDDTLNLPNGESIYLAAQAYRALAGEGKVKVQHEQPAEGDTADIPF